MLTRRTFRPGLSIFMCLALAIAGCAGRPLGTLAPIAGTVQGASLVDMLVATTRAPSPIPGVVYSGDRGDSLSVDNIVVSVPPAGNRAAGELTYPAVNPADPRTEFAVLELTSVDRAGSQRWFDRVAGSNKGGDVLIFVHGFNTTYEESVFRFAQIAHDTAATAAPILFSWPSHGSVFDSRYHISHKALILHV
ncbi:alpha/beta hydrolase [Aurantimonas sp. A2-1-M11]|uniref:alpha/beta hydrolase n=1 Tax=Aurantimonas sp. A2-1-M11 TaxID=3113712 RepID=UPI002F937345